VARRSSEWAPASRTRLFQSEATAKSGARGRVACWDATRSTLRAVEPSWSCSASSSSRPPASALAKPVGPSLGFVAANRSERAEAMTAAIVSAAGTCGLRRATGNIRTSRRTGPTGGPEPPPMPTSAPCGLHAAWPHRVKRPQHQRNRVGRKCPAYRTMIASELSGVRHRGVGDLRGAPRLAALRDSLIRLFP
jgi:hypothetical protein